MSKTRQSEYERLRERYSRTGKPLAVSFRAMLPEHGNVDRATHLLHPYPAKLLSHIPAFFLGKKSLIAAGATVLDPFCGTGTVLLEAMLAGCNALGADANPLARLIAKVKTTPLSRDVLERAYSALLARIPESPLDPAPDVVNLDYWFHPHVIRDLCRLREAILAGRNPDTKDFFLVCLSQCVRKVSLADPRLSVPVRLRGDQYPPHHVLRDLTQKRLRLLRTVNTIKVFNAVVTANIRRMEEFVCAVDDRLAGRVVGADARLLRNEIGASASGRRLRSGSIDAVITSPPYVGAQKYIRTSSLSLGWLGLCSADELRRLEDLSIGREHFPASACDELHSTGIPAADRQLRSIYRVNRLRAHIAATYLDEMRLSIVEIARVLRPGGHLVLTVGNNTITGFSFHTARYLCALAQQVGLALRLELVDTIRSRGLMTRRNATAGLITRERVFVLEK